MNTAIYQIVMVVTRPNGEQAIVSTGKKVLLQSGRFAEGLEDFKTAANELWRSEIGKKTIVIREWQGKTLITKP